MFCYRRITGVAALRAVQQPTEARESVRVKPWDEGVTAVRIDKAESGRVGVLWVFLWCITLRYVFLDFNSEFSLLYDIIIHRITFFNNNFWFDIPSLCCKPNVLTTIYGSSPFQTRIKSRLFLLTSITIITNSFTFDICYCQRVVFSYCGRNSFCCSLPIHYTVRCFGKLLESIL